MTPDARLQIYQTKVSTIPSYRLIATAVSFRLMGIDCHASYPLNSENASSSGTLTVYLTCAEMAKPPKTDSPTVVVPIGYMLLPSQHLV